MAQNAKDAAIALFSSVVSGLDNKELLNKYDKHKITYDNFFKEIREHRELIAALNKDKSMVKKGIEILEAELKRREIFKK